VNASYFSGTLLLLAYFELKWPERDFLDQFKKGIRA